MWWCLFQYGDEFMRMYFPNSKAMQRVLKGGSHILLPWGRMQEQHGKLQLGGCARLESVYSGIWDKYFARPVKIPVLAFMEKT